MSEVCTIVLEHRRQRELVDGVHPYSGAVILYGKGHTIVGRTDLPDVRYKDLIVAVSRALRDHPEADLVFSRGDRAGLHPMEASEELRLLIRDDPVAAVRRMDFQVGDIFHRERVGRATLRHGLDTLADSFGERVYLRAHNGSVEDPETGKWSNLAYGQECGWCVRGARNSHKTWLSVRLEGVDIPEFDDSPENHVEELSSALHRCRWVSALVQDLLQLSSDRLFIPRAWNSEGPWVSRAALRQRFSKYVSAKEGV